MHGWDVNTIGVWVTIGSIVVGAIVGVGKWIARKLDASDQKNDESLAFTRRIKRELLGEDPDGGPPSRPLRDLVTETLENTKGMQERMSEFAERLGKVETAREQDRQLLINHLTSEKHSTPL